MPPSPSCVSRSQLSHLAAELTKVRNQYFLRRSAWMKTAATQKNTNPKKKKPTWDVEKKTCERQRATIGPAILIYWARCFRLSDAKKTRWKVHCVCVTFSAITFYGRLLRGSKTSWHFGRLHYGLEKKTTTKKQASAVNRGKKRKEVLNFPLENWVRG